MFDTLFDLMDPPQGKKRKRGGSKRKRASGSHTFDVRGPICGPIKPYLLTVFSQYGIKVRPINTGHIMASGKRVENAIVPVATDGDYPIEQYFKFRSSEAQANWIEYVIQRTGHYNIIHGEVDKRNRDWAARYGGKMPKPWKEQGCK